ncbi:MAG: Asp23/Gls24 family envelope stress response protein [Kineosporiaceae bacterium]|nr:Asp23/Gls24 family envelope stress response protein [Aeromicrobium sp.]
MSDNIPPLNRFIPPVVEETSPDLDGHSVEELSDYLDQDRIPPNTSIENSAGCRIALAALTRLRDRSAAWIESEAAREESRDDGWVKQILAHIGYEAHAGRDIPLRHSSPHARLAITEGAVRGIVRAAGDRLGGIVVERVRLNGDVTILGEPIEISIDATALWGHSIPDAVAAVREGILAALTTHTELTIARIDVAIHDIHINADGEDGSGAGAAETVIVEQPSTRNAGNDDATGSHFTHGKGR